VIKSFKCPNTERLFNDERVKAFESIEDRARRKLVILNAAKVLDDMKIPSGNKLEKLTKDRAGQHSIRINDKYRICFVFKDGDAYDVEITDHYD
jgi:toxin HigB-1